MSNFLFAFLLALIAAAVAAYFQHRSWRNSEIEETRKREFDQCLQIVDALSRAVDRRLSAQRRFQGSLNDKAISVDGIEEYRAAVFEWMENFSSFKAKIFHFFGREDMLTFENSVHRQLVEISDILLRTSRHGLGHLSYQHQQEFKELDARLSFAQLTAFRFLKELNERISNGKIGRTRLLTT